MLVGLLGALAFAQAAGPAVGETVIVKVRKVGLKVENAVVGEATLGQPYKVAALEGDWIGLSGQGNRFGFVPKTAVVGLAESRQAFIALAKENPRDPAARVALGTALRLRNELDDAMKQFDAAIVLAPSADTYVARGVAKSDKGDYAGAIADCDEALKLDPKSAVALNNRAENWMAQKQPAKAMADFNAAVAADPKYSLARVNRAVALAKAGKPADALADLDEALKLNPLDVTAHNSAAWLLSTSPADSVRDGKRAVALAKRAEKLTAGKDWNILDTLAAAQAEAGDFEAAIATAQRAQQLADEDDKKVFADRIKRFQSKQPLRDDNRD